MMGEEAGKKRLRIRQKGRMDRLAIGALHPESHAGGESISVHVEQFLHHVDAATVNGAASRHRLDPGDCKFGAGST